MPPYRTPAAAIQVACGGIVGAAAREAVEQALPAAGHGLPGATLAINLSGAMLLGLLLEALVRSGTDDGHRRRARLVLGTGVLGAFTTYSTFAVEADLLVKDGHGPTALVYVALTVLAGLAATVAGITTGAGVHGRVTGPRGRVTGAPPADPGDRRGTG